MGTREQLFICNDCAEEARNSDRIQQNPKGYASFWKKLENMNRERLIEYIEGIECPNCGSENWFMSDTSRR